MIVTGSCQLTIVNSREGPYSRGGEGGRGKDEGRQRHYGAGTIIIWTGNFLLLTLDMLQERISLVGGHFTSGDGFA